MQLLCAAAAGDSQTASRHAVHDRAALLHVREKPAQQVTGGGGRGGGGGCCSALLDDDDDKRDGGAAQQQAAARASAQSKAPVELRQTHLERH